MNISKELGKKFNNEVLNCYDHIAVDKGLITPELLERVLNNRKEALAYVAPNGHKPETLQAIIENFEELKPSEKKMVSDYLAVKFMVLEALQGFNEALTLPSPKERFKQFFIESIDRAHATGHSIQSLVRLLEEAKNKVEIVVTSTVHPTVTHTFHSIEFQRELTHMLEAAADSVQQGVHNLHSTLDTVGLVLSKFVTSVTEGKAISHQKPITVEEERIVESENHDQIVERQKEIIEAWSAALRELSSARGSWLTPEAAEQLSFHGRNPFQNPTWVDADADGREKTDSISTLLAIQRNAPLGRKLDFRQNAEIFQNLTSGLIQVAFRSDTGFAAFCRNFVDNVNAQGKNGFISAEKSIYQDLGENKSEFLRRLITSDYNLVPADVVAHAHPVASAYIKLFKEFVAEERTRNPKLPPNVTFTDLIEYNDPLGHYENLKYKFMQRFKETPVEFMLNGEKQVWNFRIGENGYNYLQDGYQGKPRFFYETIKPTGKKEPRYVKMSQDERDVMMDTLRKFEIIRHEIAEKGKDVIGNRHEIANFSGAENFYELLFLFKQTGIINIQHGKVTDIGLAIVPLLETGDDLDNAEKIFTELLNDPLALSYFEKVGRVHIMDGFSDGAKSEGNFQSEVVAIPQSKKRLLALFKEKLPNVEVIFKDGRGSSTDRGGMPEAGLSRAENPDEVNLLPVEHRTIQSDQPLKWANSPTRGRDQMASLLIGTLAGTVAAKTRIEEERKLFTLCEKAFEFIGKVSSSDFRETIRFNGETSDFLQKMPFNAFGSSRASSRAATTKTGYESARAVPVVQKATLAGIPFNSVGLKEAMEIFISGKPVIIKVKSEDGYQEQTISSRDLLNQLAAYFEGKPNRLSEGEKALEVLKEHPRFNAFIRKTETALMSNFDPNIAREYAKRTNNEGFVEKVINSLNGLVPLCQKTLRRLSGYNQYKIFEKNTPETETMVTKLLCQGLILATDFEPDNSPEGRDLKTAQKNALLGASANDNTTSPADRTRNVANCVLRA